MNKKILIITLIVVIIVGLLAFGQQTNNETDKQTILGKIKTAGKAIIQPQQPTTDPYTPNGKKQRAE